MEIRHYTQVEAEKVGEGAEGVSVRWVISEKMGAPNFAMRVFELEPGGHTPLHSHAWEHEVFILEGSGVVRAAAEERNFVAGDAIYVSPGEEHQFVAAEQPVRFICCVPHRRK